MNRYLPLVTALATALSLGCGDFASPGTPGQAPAMAYSEPPVVYQVVDSRELIISLLSRLDAECVRGGAQVSSGPVSVLTGIQYQVADALYVSINGRDALQIRSVELIKWHYGDTHTSSEVRFTPLNASPMICSGTISSQ